MKLYPVVALNVFTSEHVEGFIDATNRRALLYARHPEGTEIEVRESEDESSNTFLVTADYVRLARNPLSQFLADVRDSWRAFLATAVQVTNDINSDAFARRMGRQQWNTSDSY